jgi:hypothetical protein
MSKSTGQKLMAYFKERWGITSTFQFIIINLVFAASGFSILFTKEYIYEWVGLPLNASIGIKILLFIVVVLPLYNIYFLIWSIILGQYQFFIRYQKKILSRFSKLWYKMKPARNSSS